MNTHLWMILPQLETELQRIYSQTVEPEAAGPEAPVAAEDLDVVGGVARIPIVGVLLSKPDRRLSMFGVAQTSYLDIQAQVAKAEADSEVKAIELHVNSGGGEASNALVETADAIFEASKLVTAVVTDMAASAAFWLAAQADEITLAGQATMVGGIGVATDRFVSEHRVSIASTDAPRKRPDPTTVDGQASIRRLLDDMHALFVTAIARGRGVSADVIRRDFGQGGVVLADEALRVGMADRVIRSGAEPDERGSVAVMDLETLRVSHPELYAAVVQVGVNTERDRVSAHIKLGEASGAMSASVQHIKDGKALTDSVVQADHMAAQLAAVGQANRRADNVDPLSNANGSPQGSSQDADIAATFALLGYNSNGHIHE